MPKKQSVWSRSYNERAYDRINVVIPKGRLEDIQSFYADRNESVNGAVNRLLRTEIGLTEEQWKSRPDLPPEGKAGTAGGV